MHWFDKAEQDLHEQLDNGEISNKDFEAEMRYLRDDLRDQAREAAEAAWFNVMGD